MFTQCLASHRTTGLIQSAAETVDLFKDQSLFSTNYASDSLLKSFKVAGQVPGRKTWCWDDAQDRLAATSTCSFGLKTVEHRDWRLARSDTKKRAKGLDPLAPEAPPISEARASLNVSASLPAFKAVYSTQDSKPTDDTKPKPLKRADKYYQALLKAEKARNEFYRREEWENFCSKANRAAEKAKKQVLKIEKVKDGGRSDSESEEEELDEEEEDPGDLQAYPGVMKVEVEVVVLRAPGADKSETESSVDQRSTHTPSSASEKSADDGIDWEAELQALQEEFGDEEKDVESEADSLPDGLGGQRIGNVHDAYNKRTALGLGGTAFFVPEVERYAFAPSLLPPPPRGEGHVQRIGHKRLKLKPRLPLEVSRHRWRDEHPYGCPAEAEFTPDMDDLRSWEESVRRVELYGTLNKLITSMPKPDGIRKMPKKDHFEETLDEQLKDSLAWKQYIKRARLIEIARNQRGYEAKPVSDKELAAYKPGVPAASAAPAADPSEVSEAAERAKRRKNTNYGGPKKPASLMPTGVPPLTMSGPPSFTVGNMSDTTKSSPPRSPKRSPKPGLMSVASGVRKGLY